MEAYSFAEPRVTLPHTVTVGSYDDFLKPGNTRNQKIFEDARRKTVLGVKDEDLCEISVRFLDILERLLIDESVTADLPKLVTDFGHRESYYEWIFPSFRMGFVVDKDMTENGWFLALDDSLGGRDFRGAFDPSLIEAIRFVKHYVQQ